jgi:hypothetical protein
MFGDVRRLPKISAGLDLDRQDLARPFIINEAVLLTGGSVTTPYNVTALKHICEGLDLLHRTRSDTNSDAAVGAAANVINFRMQVLIDFI